jgi:hypothetical protein
MTPIIITRFSFLGNSGWKIPPEDRERILFDPERLKTRLWLFENVTLASLTGQSDGDFHHYILTSEQLPDWALQSLTELCRAAYPGGNFTIDAKPVANARKYLRLFLQERSKSAPGPMVQIVVDDDDGLACDFIATVKDCLTEAGDRIGPGMERFYLSFAKGYGLVFASPTDRAPQVYRHSFPYINLGLTLVGDPATTNILAISHQSDPKKSGCVPMGGKPMFVRSVHDFNDSRVTATDRWERLAGDIHDGELAERFGFLAALGQ